jgi:endoglucanase
MWSYKATHGVAPDSWGLHDPAFWPRTPDIANDSASTIAADWREWTTARSFVLNSALGLRGV